MDLREAEILPFVQKVTVLPRKAFACPWWTGNGVFTALILSYPLNCFVSHHFVDVLSGHKWPFMGLFFPVSHHESCAFILVLGKMSKYSHELQHNLFSFVAE